MTDRQRLTLLRAAWADLAQTTEGYADAPNGVHWRNAKAKLDKLADDLQPPPAPSIGPVFKGGKSVLQHDCTHATSGIPLYPAFDDCFTAGVSVIAPEAMTVTRSSSARPGEAFYATGASKIKWWFGHLDRTHSAGTKFRKGQVIGRVAANTIGGGPHVHVGVNVEGLWGRGKQLVHRTDYRHGAPLIGVQLATHDL